MTNFIYPNTLQAPMLGAGFLKTQRGTFIMTKDYCFVKLLSRLAALATISTVLVACGGFRLLPLPATSGCRVTRQAWTLLLNYK